MQDDRVVDLPDAGVPADRGLSSLGLVMQLAGNLFAAFATMIAIDVLILAGNAQGAASSELIWFFLVVGVSVARSMFLRAAGAQLLYGNPNEPGGRLAGIRRYITFSLIHTAFVLVVCIAKWHVATKIAVGISTALALWPVVLAIVLAQPSIRRFRDDLPMAEDKGFEGASILMTVLGLCGLIGGGTALVLMVQSADMRSGMNVLILVATAMLVVRSALHVQAGLSGLRETSVDRSVELANRYANFGVISAFCAACAVLMRSMAGAVALTGFVMVVVIGWVLMAWPLVVRRFFGDRQFADLLAGDAAPVHRRAPDAGLTGLGWLLVAYATFGAAQLVIALALGSDSGDAAILFGTAATRSIWWSVVLVALQAWAGYELVRMSELGKIVGTIYGVVGAAIVVYTAWPIIEVLKHSHARDLNDFAVKVALASLAIALVLPVSTVLLVNRKIAPTARARFRPKQPATPAQ